MKGAGRARIAHDAGSSKLLCEDRRSAWVPSPRYPSRVKRGGKCALTEEPLFRTETTLVRSFQFSSCWVAALSFTGGGTGGAATARVRAGFHLTSPGCASHLHTGIVTVLPTSQGCWKSNGALCKSRRCDAVLENIREGDTHHQPRDEGGLRSSTLKWTL